MKNDMLRVGVITSTHGLMGDVKVFPTTDDPDRFEYLKEVWADLGREKVALHVDRVRYFKQFVILHFKEIPTIDAAAKYLKKDLLVTRENAIELEEGEYFIADLIGLKAFDENGVSLGTLTDVLQTGANDVYVIDDGEREILVPVIPQCVLNVDIDAGTVTVHLMEGMV